MIEIYKNIIQTAAPILNSPFMFRENMHNIHNYQILLNDIRKMLRYDLETISYRSSLLWVNLPQGYRSQKSLECLQKKV